MLRRLVSLHLGMLALLALVIGTFAAQDAPPISSTTASANATPSPLINDKSVAARDAISAPRPFCPWNRDCSIQFPVPPWEDYCYLLVQVPHNNETDVPITEFPAFLYNHDLTMLLQTQMIKTSQAACTWELYTSPWKGYKFLPVVFVPRRKTNSSYVVEGGIIIYRDSLLIHNGAFSKASPAGKMMRGVESSVLYTTFRCREYTGNTR